MFAIKATDAKKEFPKMESKINQTIIEEEEEFSEAIETSQEQPISDIFYLIQATTMKNPAHICNILSSRMKHKPQERRTNQHIIRYDVSGQSRNAFESLVDRGANGGIASSDVRVIARMDRVVDVTGIDNHQVVNLPIVTAGGVTKSQRGEILVIFHEYALIPNGKTIHSSLQLEAFKNKVNDVLIIAAGGLQCIHTIDGYAIPLNIRNDLPYMHLCPHTDTEWEELPHVVLTSDISWDPAVYDSILTEDDICMMLLLILQMMIIVIMCLINLAFSSLAQ